jgi:hypothetical protein
MPRLDAERLRQKRERLEAALAALRAQERDSSERKNAIAGRVVLDHALKDRAFAEELTRLLDRALTKRGERRLFALSTGKAPDEAAAAGPIGAPTGSDPFTTPGGTSQG